MTDFPIQILSRLGVASVFLAGTGIIAVVLLAAFRCRTPFVHTATWCLVLVQGVLFFQLPVSVPWHKAIVSHQTAIAPVDAISPIQVSQFHDIDTDWELPGEPQPAVSHSTSTPALSSDSSDQQPPWKWPQWLLMTWATGILCLLCRWAFDYVRFMRSMAGEKCDLDDWNQQWMAVDGSVAGVWHYEVDSAARKH